jgi:ubiquinone/menaquinone biosynthesis C-methylase UbiE
VDLGCGIGRLALHAIPYLANGKYTGIDISPTMIERAIQKCDSLSSGCEVNWLVQVDEHFDLPDSSYDMICAYSVFTHLEHEDTLRYLQSALRILKPAGKFLFSALLIDTAPGARYFLISADRTLVERWRSPRIVVTSRDLMTEICKLAGWQILNWYQPSAGQAVCILQKPA